MPSRKTTPEAENAPEDTKQAQSVKAADAKPKAKTTPAKANTTKTTPKKTTPAKTQVGSNSAGIAADHLRSFVERLETLEGEKSVIGQDIKDVYAEAKGCGFDKATIAQVLKFKKQKPSEREEKEALLDLYLHALGLTEGQIDESQQLGIDDANTGKAVTDNPYTTEDPRFKRWEQGWQMQTAFLAAQDQQDVA